jgi:hypothetical protein
MQPVIRTVRKIPISRMPTPSNTVKRVSMVLFLPIMYAHLSDKYIDISYNIMQTKMAARKKCRQ